MNIIKRRWPDLLIGLLVLLLLAGFAALLLGRHGSGAVQTGASPTGAVQSADSTPSSTGQPPTVQSTGQSATGQSPSSQETTAPAASTTAPNTSNQSGGAASSGSSSAGTASNIQTIPAAPVGAATPRAETNGASTATTTPSTAASAESQPATAVSVPAATDTDTGAAPRSGGAVATSETRTPTRNDYRVSLGSYGDAAAVQAATAGVSRLGYRVYTIPVASGVVAQVGPFASREAAAQALGDIQRALPKALLYPPRNAPASSSDSDSPAASSSSGSAGITTQKEADTASSQTAAAPAATGPVYLQVGAFNSTEAAQTAVGRVRALGLDPSVNAPAGKLVTVVVGPFQGRALTSAEARLQAGGIDSFRVR